MWISAHMNLPYKIWESWILSRTSYWECNFPENPTVGWLVGHRCGEKGQALLNMCIQRPVRTPIILVQTFIFRMLESEDVHIAYVSHNKKKGATNLSSLTRQYSKICLMRSFFQSFCPKVIFLLYLFCNIARYFRSDLCLFVFSCLKSSFIRGKGGPLPHQFKCA